MKRPAFGLIEIIVTMAIFSVLGVVFVNFVRNGYSIYLRGQVSSSLHDESNDITIRIANALRGTFNVISANQDNLVVQSYFAPNDLAPTQVTFARNASMISLTTVQGVALPTGGYQYDQTNAVTRTISSHFVAAANPPLFRYYNESNTLLTAPIDHGSVHMIEITTTVFSPIQLAKTASATTRVELRNLKTNL